jgi:hypothetical protein
MDMNHVAQVRPPRPIHDGAIEPGQSSPRGLLRTVRLTGELYIANERLPASIMVPCS